VLSDAAFELAHAIAASKRKSLGQVVSDLILRPQGAERGLSQPNYLGIVTFSGPNPITPEMVKEFLDKESRCGSRAVSRNGVTMCSSARYFSLWVYDPIGASRYRPTMSKSF